MSKQKVKSMVTFRSYGALEIDSRAIDGADMRKHREHLGLEPDDMAKDLGFIKGPTWKNWEEKGLPRGARAAMVRLMLFEEATFEDDRKMDADEFQNFCDIVSRQEARRALGTTKDRMKVYLREGLPKTKSALVWYLTKDMSLQL